MLDRFREALRWVGDLAVRSPVGHFLRENRIIPPTLAGVALLIFSWIVAGAIINGPEERGEVSNQAAQAPENGGGALEPGAENRNADSYAAYESKDPFRQLLAPAETTEPTGGESTAPVTTDGDESTTGGEPDGPGGGDGSRTRDDGGGRDGPGGVPRERTDEQYGDDLFDSGGNLRRPSGS